MKELYDKLNAPIPFAHVRWRRQGGGNVMYVPGEHVIQAMNACFGNLGWGSELGSIHLVGEPYTNPNGNYVVNYLANVTVSAGTGEAMCQHTDTGFGQGIDKDLGKAHESASKEAVTDAVKRACRYFGPRAGLYLYFSEGRKEALVSMIEAASSLDEALEVCKALVPSNPRSDTDKELRAAALAAYANKEAKEKNNV